MGDQADDDHGDGHERVIDLRGALGEAGHEVADMGWTDVADSSPVIVTAEEVADLSRIENSVNEMGMD